MSVAWPRVALGEVLRQVTRWERVQPDATYPLLGVRLDGAGPFLRETKLGTESAATSLNRVRAGDFIYSRLFAWRGAFGLVPTDCDGAFVSNEFPLFEAADNRVDLEYIRLWFRLPATIARVEAQSEGATPLTRNRYKEAYFLGLEIPLPPLAEQRRIVQRLTLIDTKLDEVQRLRTELANCAGALVKSLHDELSGGRTERMGDLVALDEDRVPVQPNEAYPQVGIRGFGGGLFPKPPVRADGTTYRAFNRIYPGALVVSQVKGWEGAVAVAPASLDGYFASPEYRTFRCDPTRTAPDYLDYVVRTPWFWSLLQGATQGQGARRERTRPEQLLELRVTMPSLDAQLYALSILRRVDMVRDHLGDTAPALAALMPSLLDRAFTGAL